MGTKTEESFDWERLLAQEDVSQEEKRHLCNTLMTMDSKMEGLLLKNFSVEDYHGVWTHRIGQGRIGGKACGLLLARRLIHSRLPEAAKHMQEHNSYFIGSDVFSDFLTDNGCMDLWVMDRTKEEFKEKNEELRQRLLGGQFSDDIRGQLKKMLEVYGNTPVIVRSSSFLEDGFGNSFSGKYESIFCVNHGELGERLEALESAIRLVYASTTNPSAIEYRRRRKLADAEERMALLVQRVEGQFYGNYYMPIAAGMGCSYNPYKWMENLNPDAGMLRMVMGLGSRAVERTPGDYPRLVSLDRAEANLRTTVAERHKFSQRQVDVLDLQTGTLCTKRLEEVIPALPRWQKRLVLSHDTEAEEYLRQMSKYREVYFADCQGLVEETDFIRFMHGILDMLEDEYGSPVEIEFAVGATGEGRYKVNLLQCRPMQSQASEQVTIPVGIDKQILFDVRRTSMRRSKTERIDLIVWVDPRKYYEYPYALKPGVAKKIADINRHFENEEKNMMLLVPGRIGTSSPELGVPVVYADISEFCAICEVAYSKVGYSPELSYGSHMFQDLVEADVYYGAINENSKTRIYQPQLLEICPNIFPRLWPNDQALSEIIKVYDVSGSKAELLLDMHAGRAVCWLREVQRSGRHSGRHVF